MTLEEVLPTISRPLGTVVLREVFDNLKTVMCHNFNPAMLVVAGAVMSLHYNTILQLGGCPIMVAQGESQTGKTTAVRVGLAIMGMYGCVRMHTECQFVAATLRALLYAGI